MQKSELRSVRKQAFCTSRDILLLVSHSLLQLAWGRIKDLTVFMKDTPSSL